MVRGVFKKLIGRNSLVVQWLGLGALSAKGVDLIPDQRQWVSSWIYKCEAERWCKLAKTLTTDTNSGLVSM